MIYKIDKKKLEEGLYEMIKFRINKLEADLSKIVELKTKPSIRRSKIYSYVGKFVIDFEGLIKQYETDIDLSLDSPYSINIRKIANQKINEIKDKRKR